MELKDFENNTMLFKLWDKAAEFGANRALEKCNKIKPILSKKEAYAMCNQPAVDRAIKDGVLKTIKKGGKTSNIYIVRVDFERWILKNELLSEPIGR